MQAGLMSIRPAEIRSWPAGSSNSSTTDPSAVDAPKPPDTFQLDPASSDHQTWLYVIQPSPCGATPPVGETQAPPWPETGQDEQA
eukprot:COSAG06_NODE_36502_length_446_cov_1.193084_1_plen_84_part_10